MFFEDVQYVSKLLFYLSLVLYLARSTSFLRINVDNSCCVWSPKAANMIFLTVTSDVFVVSSISAADARTELSYVLSVWWNIFSNTSMSWNKRAVKFCCSMSTAQTPRMNEIMFPHHLQPLHMHKIACLFTHKHNFYKCNHSTILWLAFFYISLDSRSSAVQ